MKAFVNVLGLSLLVLLACNGKKNDAPTEPSKNAKPASVEAKQESKTPDEPKPKDPEPAGTVDFDALADASNASASHDLGPNNALFVALYHLEKWQLLTFPDSKSLPPGLNLETHDGKKWVMAFTDSARMHAYATEREQLNSDGSMMGMAVPAQTSFDFFDSLKAKGVFGVRFNQGDHGWFVPMDNLRGIHSYLLSKGLL